MEPLCGTSGNLASGFGSAAPNHPEALLASVSSGWGKFEERTEGYYRGKRKVMRDLM